AKEGRVGPAAPDGGPAGRPRWAGAAARAGRPGARAGLGTPSGAARIGDRRWRAPEPPPAWAGTREATRVGAPCAQLASPFGGIEDVAAGRPAGSEDCLFLNVWAPDAAGSARLPVMLWIHAGGTAVGHGGFFAGSDLATAGNVVVVTVNYRLGPFGWFRHAALRDDATTDAERSGDFATLDLLRALAWVRDNAAAFGGDPGNV